MPRVREAYNKENFDLEIMREMGEQGFLGCTISEYDLPGVSSTAYGKYLNIYNTFHSYYRSDQQGGRASRQRLSFSSVSLIKSRNVPD